MKAVLKSVIEGATLSRAEAGDAMLAILEGISPSEQVAAFLAVLHARGETTDELLGFLDVLKARAVPVPVTRRDLFDTCGTGGDGAGTFNISTAAAFVVAGAGVGVAKHGNRSVSSRCGSMDVLEALGVPVNLSPEQAAADLDRTGFAFLFAPQYHPALAAVAPVRKAMGVRTVFNLLGPLVNPARVRRQLVGVPHACFLRTFAELLRASGCESAMVVHSDDGLDEISLSAPTSAARLENGEITTLKVTPEDFGVERASLSLLAGGDAEENAALITRILRGEETGPKRDIVVINAAAALVVAGKAENFRDGALLAGKLLVSGGALEILEAVR